MTQTPTNPPWQIIGGVVQIGDDTMFNLKLPLWDRVIFVDWNGVLSRDQFWTSILGSSVHPLNGRLAHEVRRLFENSELVNRWMRGELTSKEVIDALDVELGKRFGSDFLERRLLRDCQHMEVNEGLIAVLSEACTRSFVVIATDNMDCFYEQVLFVRAKRRVRASPENASRLKDIVWRFDDVLCSSALGTLKCEQPELFFGRWLRSHGLPFGAALLLDDTEENCGAFKKAGGAAMRVLRRDFEEGFGRLRPMIFEWLDHAQTVRPYPKEA